MNWDNKFIDLGTVKVGRLIKVIFNAVDDIHIESMSSSCGCSTPKYDKDNKKLIVNFIPDKVPVHLKLKGFYETTKSITLHYTNGEMETLSFKAKITD